jgi:RND family efflux transporter MFP subunit
MKKSFILSLIAIALIFACSSNQKKEEKKIYKPVKFSYVQLSDGVQTKVFNGVSQSGQESKLSFRTNGLITYLKVKTGNRVKAGQLLARVDDKDVRLSFEKAKSALLSAEIQMQTAKSSFNRTKKLYASNNVSLSDYEKAKNGFANAQSGYQNALRTLDLQKSQLEYTKIIAPTNGIVTAVNAELNEFAGAGNPIIVISAQDKDIEINVGVPEVYISKINLGDKLEVKFTSLPNKKYKGVVTEIGYSSAGSATYPVIVRLTNQTKEVRLGMPANVEFKFGNKTKDVKITVPVKAVGEDQNGNFVFVLTKKDDHYVAQKAQIKLGALLPEGFQVLEGVKENDIVAIAGVRTLFTGMEVKLLK